MLTSCFQSHRAVWIAVGAVALVVGVTVVCVPAHRLSGESKFVDGWRPVDPIATLSAARLELPLIDGDLLASDDRRPLFTACIDGVYLGHEKIVPLPILDVAKTTGIDAKYKLTATGYYVTSLGGAARSVIETIRRGTEGGVPRCESALVAFDKRLPQRVIAETMYTLGQNEFCEFSFVGRDKGSHYVLEEHRAPTGARPIADSGFTPGR